LTRFPERVRQDIGYGRYLAQRGERALNAKTMRGFSGSGVVELVEDDDGDTYRCVYTVRLQMAVYVLHAFKKKSKRGTETPQHEIELIRARLRDATVLDKAHSSQANETNR
jgi:phage-related protein